MADVARVRDHLVPVEGHHLVDAEPGHGGHRDHHVVAGAVGVVEDREAGVDLGGGGDAGRGVEVPGHAPTTAPSAILNFVFWVEHATRGSD